MSKQQKPSTGKEEPQALYMDLTLDFTFKKIFKAEENRDILENCAECVNRRILQQRQKKR